MAGEVDRTLVERARDGDQDAADELLRTTAHRLYPLAYRIVRDRDLADDAVQRTLVAIWRELPRLRQAESFDAWSYRMLSRFGFDELKKDRRHVRQLEPDLAGSEDQTIDLGHRDQLERAFGQLSLEHRTVLALVYYEGLSGTQAAARLGVSAGTVASRVHYALRHLRAAIDAGERSVTGHTGQPSMMLAAASR